jgi:putative ATP-binding cassette transporter
MLKRLPSEEIRLGSRALLVRFWQSACGFWQGRARPRSWSLAVLLITTVGLQLYIQYRLNYWSRDFFNAIEKKDEGLLWLQISAFAPLAATSLTLAVVSLWGRMTTQREWRRWLSNHLYDYWVHDGRHTQLRFMSGEHQTPEYRIAEDARVATELPVDLVLGLLSAVLTAIVFIGVLQSIGDSLEIAIFGLKIFVPSYLVVAVILYSLVLTAITMIIGRRLVRVIEDFKGAEAELRAAGSRLRAAGEEPSPEPRPGDHRRALRETLDHVIERWRALCWQLMRMTVVSHTNVLVGPSIALLLCAPKYIAGTMTLGAMVQAAAAFAVVQGAFSWVAESYGRLAEWASSAKRVGSLLQSLDRVETASGSREREPPCIEQPIVRAPVPAFGRELSDVMLRGTQRASSTAR